MSIHNLKTDDYLYTNDLGLATAISLFYPLDSIDHTQSSNKAQFIFKREKGIDELVETYWRGELKASLLSYFNQLKITKSRLYEGR